MSDPGILFIGAVSFIISFLMHLMIWRSLRPVKHLFWLAFIFIILPILIYILLAYFGYFRLSIKNIFFIVPWHLALSAAYIMSYPAIHAECPSFKIILAVRASMPKGMSAKAINDIFSEEKLLTDRFEDLINDNFVFKKDGKWAVSLKGRLLLVCFSVYRKLLGLPMGEG